MKQSTIIYNDQTTPDYVANEVNKIRRLNKDEWFQVNLENQTFGTIVSLKIYNTWIQVSSNNKFSTAMGQNVTQFKQNIKSGFKVLLDEY